MRVVGIVVFFSMSGVRIRGYCDPLSAAPGEAIRFFVSCDDPGEYRAEIVRLLP